jgi:hypothetical protein
MAFYLSPLVDVNEIDLSTTIPAVATSIGVAVLRDTYKGPEKKQVLVTNENELINMFGRWGNKLYCTRAMSVSATFAGTKAASGAGASFTAYTTSNAYKFDTLASQDPDYFHDDVSATGTDPFWLIASSRGVWGNSIRVAVADMSTYTGMVTGDNNTWDTYDAITSVDSKPETAKGYSSLGYSRILECIN